MNTIGPGAGVGPESWRLPGRGWRGFGLLRLPGLDPHSSPPAHLACGLTWGLRGFGPILVPAHTLCLHISQLKGLHEKQCERVKSRHQTDWMIL